MSNLATMFSAGHAFRPVVGNYPNAQAAGTRNGAAIDRATPGGVLYASLTLKASVGVTSGTPTSFSVDNKIQHSADGSTGWTDYVPPGASAAAAVAQLTAASSMADVDISLEGARRYVRVAEVVAFVGGTSPKVETESTVILAGADRTPV